MLRQRSQEARPTVGLDASAGACRWQQAGRHRQGRPIAGATRLRHPCTLPLPPQSTVTADTQPGRRPHLSLRRCTRSRRCSCCAQRTCAEGWGGRGGGREGGRSRGRGGRRRRLACSGPPVSPSLDGRDGRSPRHAMTVQCRPGLSTRCAAAPTCGTTSAWQDSTMSSSTVTKRSSTAGSGSARALIRLHRGQQRGALPGRGSDGHSRRSPDRPLPAPAGCRVRPRP